MELLEVGAAVKAVSPKVWSLVLLEGQEGGCQRIRGRGRLKFSGEV